VSGADALCLAHLPRFIYTWYLAKKLGARWVPFVLENRPMEARYHSLTLAWAKPLLRALLKSAFWVMAGNHGAAALIQQLGVSPDRCEVLLFSNWGVDLEVFRPGASKRSAQPTVLFIGRLVAEKGLTDTLAALAVCAEKVSEPIQVLLVGEGPLKTQLANDYCRHPKLKLTWLGSVPNSDLPLLFGKAWLTVAPSKATRRWAEQIGMVNFQSLSCGTPVITTRCGAVPEFIPDAGAGAILLDEGDVPGLAEAILRCLGDPAYLNQLRQAARPYALAHFDARRHVQIFEQRLRSRLEHR
jgi:glycosyltransferase involved in cell wall biosynthesis